MSQGSLLGLAIAGLVLFLGSFGSQIAGLDSWDELKRPAFVGATLGQLAGAAMMVLGALGIDIKKRTGGGV